METGRLETFADGVFAIAATLLILNVGVSCDTPCDLRALVLHAWPSYAAYAASFVTMGIIWANHHTVMSQIGRANRTFLMLTVLISRKVGALGFLVFALFW
jgi:TMEM175 potassium channel family protein